MNQEILAQAFVITGAFIFLVLGIFHGVLTLQDLSNPRTFTPPDLALRQAMQESRLAIHSQTNLWRAWLGFNLSHSLGLVMFGGTFGVIGLFYFSAFVNILLLQGCALFISVIYLVLSLKFWFSSPAMGSGMALACFAIGSGLVLFHPV
jgi:hypothetical protein